MIVLSEVVLPMTTGLPKDVSVNALHWETVGPANDADFLAITSEIDNFYNLDVDAPGQPWDNNNIAQMLSRVLVRSENACKVHFYDAQADPKVLLATTNFTLGDDAESNILPNEVAVCLSLTSVEGAGAILQRNRRGRVYLGPLNTACVGEMTVGGASYPAFNTDYRMTVALAAERMATGPTTVTWTIYSPTLDAAFAVSGGFIDNEFDTQRRRQFQATTRTTWGEPFV